MPNTRFACRTILLLWLSLLGLCAVPALCVAMEQAGPVLRPAGISKPLEDFTRYGYGKSHIQMSLKDKNGKPLQGVAVNWLVVSADNRPNKAVTLAFSQKRSGLFWGEAPDTDISAKSLVRELDYPTTSTTNAKGVASIWLSDILGERFVSVQAKAVVDGTVLSATQQIFFGKGPLVRFMAPADTALSWAEAYGLCVGQPFGGEDQGGWMQGADKAQGRMPSRAELLAVSLPQAQKPGSKAYGAALAAGWPEYWYWTGEAHSTGQRFSVRTDGLVEYAPLIGSKNRTVCRRIP